MRRLGSVLLFLLLSSTAAFAQNHPVPFVNVPLSPSIATPGGSGFTLTVRGAGFVSGATVNWNGQALGTTFVNVDELTATVLASDIAVATSAEVTVTNPTPGGGRSNVVYFAVSAPATLQFSISPSSTPLPQYYSVTGAIAADLTRDGNLDLTVSTTVPAERSTEYGWTVLGNGDGSFQGVIQAFPQTNPFSAGYVPVIGDFNGDGVPDLVETACLLSNPETLTLTCQVFVYLGNGDGTFSQSTAITENDLYSFGEPVVGDFNGDGKLDVAVEFSNSTGTDGIMVFLGNGDGTLQSGLQSNIADIATVNVAGDFDGDGKLDLVGSANSGTAGIVFFHGNGDGTFAAPTTSYSIGQNLLGQVLVADLNGDGKLDLVTLQSLTQQIPEDIIYSFTVMLGNGDGTFQSAVAYPIGTVPSGTNMNLALGDFASNGKLDIAYPNTPNTLIVPGNGDGTFDLADIVTVPAPSTFLVAGDFNNDGKLDLALAYETPGVLGPQVFSYLLQDAPLGGFSQSSLTFAAEPLGTTSSPQSVTLTNNGTGPLNVSNIAIAGRNSGDFSQSNNCPSTLAIGASCPINISFTPTANGPRTASLSVTDNAPASPQTVSLSGSGGLASVQFSPSSIDFANEAVGNTSPAQTVTVTNAGYSATNISSISVTGPNASDFSETNTCGSSLAAGANCSVSVTFTPAVMGVRTAAVAIVDDAPGSPQTIALTGNGSGIVGVSPSTVTFSGQYVGTTGLPQSVTVTNNAATPLTISKVTTSPADFASVNACGSTLAPGASCAIGVFFDPTQAGSRTGTLTINDSAAGSPQTVTLNGTGQDFSMASSSSSATVSPGQTANYTLAITPGGGFNQKVSFSCAGVPALSTCAVTPNSLTLSSSAASSVTVAVTTTGNSASLPQLRWIPPNGNLGTAWLSVAVFTLLLGAFFAHGRKRPLPFARPLAFGCLLLVVLVLSSCGGGGNHGGTGTPAGTYTLTVTGTFNSGSTTLTHNTTLTLVVQ
jgi:FG-GAP-like repeat/Abnormal spindle-like microcephaly-assoc'd, ASPM-SPD-2-Hydin